MSVTPSRLLLAWIIACSGAACGAEGSGTAAEETPTGTITIVRLMTGPHGGGFVPMGERVAEVVRAGTSTIRVQSIASSGAIDNATAVQKGEADLGLTFADVAYTAYTGRLRKGTAPFNHLRAIAVLQVTPISLVARSALSIGSPAGLRGRRVAVGLAGGGTELSARLILAQYGLGPETVHLVSVGFTEAANRLLDGTLDAMFDNASNQAESLRRAIAGGAKFVPIDGPPVNTLRRDYPFLKLTVITPDLYPSVRQPVHTIGVDALMICREDLDEALVYELTKHIFAFVRSVSEQGAPHGIEVSEASATPIPLHAGAARFYRERELSR